MGRLVRRPRHTLSALVGAVAAQGRDNADAVRLVRPGINIADEYASREAGGLGEAVAEANLYDDVRPALGALRNLGVRVIIARNWTARMRELLRDLDLPAELIATSGDWGVAKPGAAGLRHQPRATSCDSRRCSLNAVIGVPAPLHKIAYARSEVFRDLRGPGTTWSLALSGKAAQQGGTTRGCHGARGSDSAHRDCQRAQLR